MKKVLFVDDDRVTQMVLAAALRANFEVIGETSGAKVLERAEAVRPHAILLDLSMPNVDGFEVLTRLKKHPLLSNIAVICVSGKVDEESRNRAYRAGAAGFIGKPIDVKQISQDLTSLLESLNTEIKSDDSRRTVYIGRDTQSTSEQLRAELLARLELNQKSVIMSLSPGESFFQQFEKDHLRTGHLIYLEIKPSLIVRLPYLEDLSSVEADIKGFIPADSIPHELFFDGPEQILNIVDQEKSAAAIIALSESLIRIFGRVHYFSRYGTDENHNRHINTMAKLLARVA